MSTVFASITTPGPPGPPGRTSLWITGAGVPVPAQGLDGDMYLDNTTGNVYGPKASGVWGPVVANIKGTTGNTGNTGPAGYSPRYIVGAAPPTVGTGNDGDMYLDNVTFNLYGPKTAGAWGGSIGVIKGPKGDTGLQGPPGVAYTARGLWVSTTQYTQGDMVSYSNVAYIALQSLNTGNVPLSSPTWWQAVAQGGVQTPWASNINAAGFNLSNVGQIGVVPVTTPSSAATAIQLAIGEASNNSAYKLTLGYYSDGTSYNGAIQATQNGPAAGRLLLQPSGGSVGIGTASPANKFVVSNAGFTGFEVNPAYAFAGINGVYLVAYDRVASAYRDMHFDLGGDISTNVTFRAGGWVGIGAIPDSKLHVSGGILHVACDSVGGGGASQLMVGGLTDLRKNLWLSFDTTANVGRIDAGIAGVSWNAIALNAGGGQVGVNCTPITNLDVRVNTNLHFGVFFNTPAAATIGAFNDGFTAWQPLSINPGSQVWFTGGNVGIGTTTPLFLLSLGSSIANRKLAVYDAGGDFFGFGVSASQFRYDSGAGSDHVFYTDAGTGTGERVRFAASGRVGIGTASPLSLLNLNTPATGANTDILTFSSAYSVSSVEQRIKWFGAGNFNLAYIGGGFDPATAADGYLAFGTGGNAGGAGSQSERMRITYNGRVGIGTVSAGFNTEFKLHVVGPGAVEVGVFTPSGNTANTIYVQDSGFSAGCGGAILFGAGQGSHCAIRSYLIDGTPNSAGYLSFYIRNATANASLSEAMRIAPGGVVTVGYGAAQGTRLSIIPGINATSVQAANFLTIGEATNTVGYYLSLGYLLDASAWKGCIQQYSGGTPSTLLINPLGGVVGIGKLAPGYALDVQGDVNIPTGYSFRVNGVPIGGSSYAGPTTQNNATGVATVTTSYRNTTGKPMWVTVSMTLPAGTNSNAYTDANPNPSTMAASVTGPSTAQTVDTLNFVVLPNNYYRVLVNGVPSPTITSWIEWY